MSTPKKESMTLTTDFARRIREARDAAFLTQEDAAKKLGVSVRTYQGWESGSVFPQMRHRSIVSQFIEQEAAA